MCSAKKALFLLLLFSLFFLLINPLHAETNLNIPAEYGEVIYRFNEKSPNQIFIIGISHRDALTSLNGDNTPKVQAQIYKIGDWLVHQQGLELLLPEGFFRSLPSKTEKKNANVTDPGGSCASFDTEALERRLSDNRVYVNAEMLLKENHSLRLQQIEDKNLYDTVRDRLFKLASCGSNSREYSLLKSELEYFQEKRTAAMLQKIPFIVNEEFRQGNIKKKKAIFTIGMFHIHNIITFLDDKAIKIHSPLPVSTGNESIVAELNVRKEDFGVSVILPRMLASDQKILKMNELYEVVKKCQDNPVPHNP